MKMKSQKNSERKSKRIIAAMIGVSVIASGIAVLPEVALAASPLVICVERGGFDVYIAGGSFSRLSCRTRDITIPLSGAVGPQGPQGPVQGRQAP